MRLSRKTGFRAVAVGLGVLAGVAISVAVWQARQNNEGVRLNRRSWEAAYRERGLPVPPGGPREGYFAERHGKRVFDSAVGWHDSEYRVPGLYDMDPDGMQRLAAPCARYHILILGGSVAEGHYASSIETTYFARLMRILESRGIPVKVTVFAAGLWKSGNELAAFTRRGLAQRPDRVLVINGLNDLVWLSDRSEKDRVVFYLDNMRRLCDVAAARGIPVVFALQPFLPQKPVKSRLEKRTLEISYSNLPALERSWKQIRAGLQDLARRPGVRLIDTSGVADAETKTVFSDLWHFSDPGHELLGRALGEGLFKLLEHEPRARPRPGCSQVLR